MKVFQPTIDITTEIRKEQQVTTLPTQLLLLLKCQQPRSPKLMKNNKIL